MYTDPVDEPKSTEAELLEIWQAIFETDAINVNASFLELGGDSLSAMMCVSRVRKHFEYEIAIGDFFEDDASIAHFAAEIDQAR